MSDNDFEFDMPDDARIAVAQLHVLSYIRDDGTSGYQITTRGNAPMTTYLGMTVVAQNDIMDWRNGVSEED